MWRLWIVLLLAACAGAQTEADPPGLVRLAQGPVLGHLDPTGSYYSFYNIPYASVPTGTQRFKAPLPPPVWMQTLDAVNRRIVCPQLGGFMAMQEDCLVANIFVPNTNETNLSVVVNVHGGGYQFGFGSSEVINNLVETKKIIAVTFNYRLGVHGFLCLGTEDIPGNAGLKDQLALLRWVNKNIVRFGGNPDDVTLSGCSAGGGSIEALTLSSATNGLFKKAIIGSGASFGAVGVQFDPLENAKTFARRLNFTNVENITALEDFYKTATFEELISQGLSLLTTKNAAVLFTPCVERDVGQEIILEDAPINIIEQGNYKKIPQLYGFADMEGLMQFFFFNSYIVQMNEKFSDFVPEDLAFENDEEKNEIAKIVKEFYFGNETIGPQHFMNYTDYYTDIMFAYPMLRSLKLRVESNNDNIYLYEYSFVDENSTPIPYAEQRGAFHCDQSTVVYDGDLTNITDEYREMTVIMRQLWRDFILTGTPGVENSQLPAWPVANASGSPHMSIGRTIELKGLLLEDRVAFWDSIYQKHYRKPIPPRVEEPSTDGGSTISVTRCLTASIILLYYLL